MTNPKRKRLNRFSAVGLAVLLTGSCGAPLAALDSEAPQRSAYTVSSTRVLEHTQLEQAAEVAAVEAQHAWLTRQVQRLEKKIKRIIDKAHHWIKVVRHRQHRAHTLMGRVRRLHSQAARLKHIVRRLHDRADRLRRVDNVYTPSVQTGTQTVRAFKAWARARVGSYQFRYLDLLWTRESGWNRYADNPTSSAYGIPQALPGSKMASAGADWRWNGYTQMRWGLSYIKGRYGTCAAAWAHSQRYGWY